jgi:histone-lysine N-methyltransferase SETD2
LDGSRLSTKQRTRIAAIDNKLKGRKDEFEDVALEAEIEKLISSGCLKNKNQTMTLARLMVRTEETRDRVKLLDIINNTRDTVFLRLFMDYHGLQLLWSWMVDTDDPILKASILQILSILPVPNRTVLVDSKVMELVEKWAKEVPVTSESPPAAATDSRLPLDLLPNETPLKQEEDEADVRADSQNVDPVFQPEAEPDRSDHHVTQADSSIQPENIKTEPPEVDPQMVKEEESTKVEEQKVPVTDDCGFQLESNESSQDSKSSAHPAADRIDNNVKAEADCSDKPKDVPTPRKQPQSLSLPIHELAQKLLIMWKDLKEGFKIPRLVREKRQNDEKEADQRAQEYEMNRARGMPYNYNLTGKRGPEERDGIASILFRNKKSKKANQPAQAAAQYSCDIPMDSLQIPPEPAAPKVSKEHHRMQVELDMVRQEYEEKLAAYKAQIEMVEAAMSKHVAPALTQPDHMPAVPQLPLSRNSLDESFPMSSEYSDHHTEYDPQFSAPTSLHEQDLSPDCPHTEYDETYIGDDEYNWLPEIIVDNQSNILIDCSPQHDELMPDDKAAVQADYGVDFHWFKKQDQQQQQEHPPGDLFDPVYPPPGIYYECVFSDTVYFVPPFAKMPGESVEFAASEVKSSLPDAKRLTVDHQTALPPHWRRTRDNVTGSMYYYHKKTGRVQWNLPDYDCRPKPRPEKVEENKIQSVVASADSTSTPQLIVPGSSSPSNSLCSPPGIFAITNGHLKKSDPRKVIRSDNEPDQSGRRKSSKGIVYDTTRKGLEKFKLEVSEFVKKVLNPYRQPECRIGRIETNEDFKQIARKVSPIRVTSQRMDQ